MKKLERSIGLTAVVAISLSAMLGSGIFVLPGLAAAKTGPSIWLAYLLAGLCVLPAALSKAELATAMPASGGTYIYIVRTFGPLAGTVAGLGLWVSLMLKSAFALIGFGAYLVVLVDLPLKPTALVLLGAVVALNVAGVRKVSSFQVVVVVLAVAGLTTLVALGAPSFDGDRMSPFFTEGAGGFIGCAGFVFVSYAGVTKIAAIAEEVKDPDRNLPLGMLLSLGLAASMYGLVNAVLVGNVPMEQLVGDKSPIYTLAVIVGGGKLGVAVAALAVVTMTSMALAGVLATSRFPFAMSRDGLLPAGLQAVSKRFHTPVASIALTGIVMAICIITLDLARIAKLASAFKILLFAATNVCVLVLRESHLQWYDPAYRTPAYPWVQIFGIACAVMLLATMGLDSAVAALAIGVVGTGFYFAYGRSRASLKGVVKRMGRREDLLVEARTSTAEAVATAVGDAPVIVALMGHERTPETLVEVGAALAHGEPVEVLHITEEPEQIDLDVVLEDTPLVNSMRRRVAATAEMAHNEIRFSPVVTHDEIGTVHRAAQHPSCRWLVKQWRLPRTARMRDPRAWLHNHLPCNLALFRDAGVRYIREILVFAEPGPDDALVVSTADHIAAIEGARLTFIRWMPDDADQVELAAAGDYLDQVRVTCTVDNEVRVVRGPSFLEAMTAATVDYDLLVMGAPEESFVDSMVRGTVKDRLTAKAACSVLRLQTPLQKQHEAFDPSRVSGNAELDLLNYTDPRTVEAKTAPPRKDALFSSIARSLGGVVEGVTVAEINDALWAREKAQNTAVGRGVAMPHGTLSGLDRTWLGIYTAAKPVAYQAADGQPVDVFFATIGPPAERNRHLLLLAALSKLIVGTDLLDRLRAAGTTDEVVDAIKICLERTPRD